MSETATSVLDGLRKCSFDGNALVLKLLTTVRRREADLRKFSLSTPYLKLNGSQSLSDARNNAVMMCFVADGLLWAAQGTDSMVGGSVDRSVHENFKQRHVVASVVLIVLNMRLDFYNVDVLTQVAENLKDLYPQVPVGAVGKAPVPLQNSIDNIGSININSELFYYSTILRDTVCMLGIRDRRKISCPPLPSGRGVLAVCMHSAAGYALF